MMQHLSIKHQNGKLEIPVADIIRIQSNSNYCRIFRTKGCPVTVAKILQWFERELPLSMFARVHRSHLVNRNYVQIVYAKENQIILTTGESIVISRRKRNAI